MTDVALIPAGTGLRRPLWRFAAIVLFLGLPLGCATGGLLALLAGLDATHNAEHADETARVIVHRLDHKPAQAAADLAPLYLASTSASLARAELQAKVARLIDAAGGRLIEVRPTDQPDSDAPGRVSVEATLAIGNTGLLDLLYAIETGLPLLVVPRLDVLATTGAGGQPGHDLQVTLTLEGRWRASP